MRRGMALVPSPHGSGPASAPTRWQGQFASAAHDKQHQHVSDTEPDHDRRTRHIESLQARRNRQERHATASTDQVDAACDTALHWQDGYQRDVLPMHANLSRRLSHETPFLDETLEASA